MTIEQMKERVDIYMNNAKLEAEKYPSRKDFLEGKAFAYAVCYSLFEYYTKEENTND